MVVWHLGFIGYLCPTCAAGFVRILSRGLLTLGDLEYFYKLNEGRGGPGPAQIHTRDNQYYQDY